MRLLYVADNGFSNNNGSYYYSRPNEVNSSQYKKYFDSICYIARRSGYNDKMLPIDRNCKVELVGRYDIRGLKKAMTVMAADYDAVLVRNGLLGCFAAKYAKKLGKVLISYCGADPFEFKMTEGTLSGKIIAYYWRYLEKRKMKFANYAHYCTKVLYDRYPCNCLFLICSNVSVKADESILRRRFEKLFKPYNVLKIGLIGQYKDNECKGVLTIIKALRLLGDRYKLEIVGEGNPARYQNEINKLSQGNHVHFLGYISDREELNAWLDDIDIYVQPSLSEGLPRATIEAMSRGCPVIASNVCGLIDLLPNDYLIKPKDYRTLAEKIKWLSNPEQMKKAAEQNYYKSLEFTEDTRDKKLDEFFLSMTIDS